MEKVGACLECSLLHRPCAEPVGSPSPNLVVLQGFPMAPKDPNDRLSAFGDKGGAMVQRMVENIGRRISSGANRVRAAYCHAVECAPEWDPEAKKFQYDVSVINHCAPRVHRYLDRAKPGAILALGTDALKCLGFKGTARGMRGGVYSFRLNDGTEVPVVVSYHIADIKRTPGLTATLEKDVEKACRLASGGDFGEGADVNVLIEHDEIVQRLRDMRDMMAKLTKVHKQVSLALDTETTSLTPYNPEDRVIAVSLAMYGFPAVAFPFEHRGHPFTAEELAEIRTALEELFNIPGVSILGCNGKFDTQWLKYHYGLNMPDYDADVMLAEHCLDEDKKGEYSLKDITRDRFPALGRYEQELKRLLADAQGVLNDEWAMAEDAWRDYTSQSMLDWWLELDEDARIANIVRWQEKGWLPNDSKFWALKDVKRRKLKGEYVIPKKYREELSRMLKAIPVEQLEGIELPRRMHGDKPREVTFEDVDMAEMLWYAAMDAHVTRQISIDQQSSFTADLARINAALAKNRPPVAVPSPYHAYKNQDMPLSAALAHMEYYGVGFDRDKCERYIGTVEEKMEELKDSLFNEVGYKFSLSSSSGDLAKILFEDRGLPVLKRTDSGAPSTDADTLKQLYDEYDQGFLKNLLAYRKMDKVLHTYLKNWMKMSLLDGKLHCQFNQIGTATFRLSSNQPNLQNIPFALKEADLNLKELFIPDYGYTLAELDISNAEMRILTAYSRDKNLTDAFNTGKDLHCLTAASISDYSYDDLKAHKEDKTSDQYRKRQLAKKVNFGTIFGMSGKKFQEQIWSEMRIRESEEQCQAYLDGFFKAYPDVRKYMDDTINFVMHNHFSYTYTGRIRRFPIAAYDRAQAARMGRQAVNARIQTTSSDTVMRNLIDVHNWLLRENLGRILLTVHDSIVFQVKEGTTGVMQQLKKLVTEDTAVRCPWLPVEWKFDAGCGSNYGDTHGELD